MCSLEVSRKRRSSQQPPPDDGRHHKAHAHQCPKRNDSEAQGSVRSRWSDVQGAFDVIRRRESLHSCWIRWRHRVANDVIRPPVVRRALRPSILCHVVLLSAFMSLALVSSSAGSECPGYRSTPTQSRSVGAVSRAEKNACFTCTCRPQGSRVILYPVGIAKAMPNRRRTVLRATATVVRPYPDPLMAVGVRLSCRKCTSGPPRCLSVGFLAVADEFRQVTRPE